MGPLPYSTDLGQQSRSGPSTHAQPPETGDDGGMNTKGRKEHAGTGRRVPRRSVPRRPTGRRPAVIRYADAPGAQLYRLARDRKIAGRCAMTRTELIAAIEAADERSAEEHG